MKSSFRHIPRYWYMRYEEMNHFLPWFDIGCYMTQAGYTSRFFEMTISGLLSVECIVLLFRVIKIPTRSEKQFWNLRSYFCIELKARHMPWSVLSNREYIRLAAIRGIRYDSRDHFINSLQFKQYWYAGEPENGSNSTQLYNLIATESAQVYQVGFMIGFCVEEGFTKMSCLNTVIDISHIYPSG